MTSAMCTPTYATLCRFIARRPYENMGHRRDRKRAEMKHEIEKMNLKISIGQRDTMKRIIDIGAPWRINTDDGQLTKIGTLPIFLQSSGVFKRDGRRANSGWS